MEREDTERIIKAFNFLLWNEHALQEGFVSFGKQETSEKAQIVYGIRKFLF
jgi:hypothetical protein